MDYRTREGKRLSVPRKRITSRCISLAKSEHGAKVVRVRGGSRSGDRIDNRTMALATINKEYGAALQFPSVFELSLWAERIGLEP